MLTIGAVSIGKLALRNFFEFVQSNGGEGFPHHPSKAFGLFANKIAVVGHYNYNREKHRLPF